MADADPLDEPAGESGGEPDSEFDGPWKEALEVFFDSFLGYFFPSVAARVDWTAGYEFLDKELETLHPDAATGRGTVDKLVRVRLATGDETWVYVHIEVQSQAQATFAQRMFTYNHRLWDRYGRMPVSLAILGDDRPLWRPDVFEHDCCGCTVRFRFLVAKLLEWLDRDTDELDADRNPFAVLTRAHLATLATRGDPDARLEIKWQLVRGLYDRGFDRVKIAQLFRLIDWMSRLSPPRQTVFNQRILAYEKERTVPFISVLEQIAMDKGEALGKARGEALGEARGEAKGLAKGEVSGLHQAIESILDTRFGADGVALMPQVRQITDAERLRQLTRNILTAADLSAVTALLPTQAPTDGR